MAATKCKKLSFRLTQSDYELIENYATFNKISKAGVMMLGLQKLFKIKKEWLNLYAI